MPETKEHTASSIPIRCMQPDGKVVTITVRGWVFGPLAVHFAIGVQYRKFAVTHIESGMLLMTYDVLEDATGFVKTMLAKDLDWNFKTQSELPMRTRLAAVEVLKGNRAQKGV